jgi:hypothetical protein
VSLTESDSERGKIGHEITQIVGESTEMVGHITEVGGDTAIVNVVKTPASQADLDVASKLPRLT